MKFPFYLMPLLLICVNGCVAPKQLMINPTNKHQVDCSTSGWGWLGTPLALKHHNDCINEYKILGYIPLEEFEKNEAPKLDQKGGVKASPCLRPVWVVNSEWHYLVNDREVHLKFIRKENFKGIPIYRVINERGGFIFYNEDLGIAAKLNSNNDIEVEYKPPFMSYDWPLSVGKTWNASVKSSESSYLFINYIVKSYGRIKVPAGDFYAYYIVGKSDNGIRIIELWYSPEVKHYVKAIAYVQPGIILEELQSYNHPNIGISTTSEKVDIEKK
jgi:hypothetical protein